MQNSQTRIRVVVLFLPILLLLVMMPAGIGRPAPLHAQDELRYTRYDVAIDVAEDGSFTVSAEQTVHFDDAYSTAFAEIPTDRAAAIRDVQIFQRDIETDALIPLRFTVSEDADGAYVEWEYDEVEAGDARTFVLQYKVEGGLWLYDDRDILRWFAINADRSGLTVEQATVTVTLPEAAAGSVSAEVISVNGEGVVEGNRALFVADGPLADGEPFEIEVGFAHGVVQAVRQPWQQAEDAEKVRVEVSEVQVGLTVQYDGRLDIGETTTIAVEAGVLEQGFRTIHLVYMDAIRDIRVLQDGAPLVLGREGCSRCYVVHEQPAAGRWAYFDAATGEVIVDEGAAGRVDIDWYGAPVAAGETTQITLHYAVVGAVRVGEDAQAIHMELLPDSDALTARASLQIMPPPRLAADALVVDSGARMGAAEAQADGSVIYRNLELPATRARWEVMVTMPPGATSAMAPQWQAQFEQAVAAEAAAATAAAQRKVATRTSSIVAGMAGVVAGLWIWFRYGRKRTRALLKGYVAEPPSDLAPGIVAYLMDRQASERGVLASLMQLAAVGLIEVDLTSDVQLRRKAADAITPGQRFTVEGRRVTLAPHQTMLFNEVLLPSAPMDHFVALDALAGALRARLPQLYVQMGQDAQSYFLAGDGGGGCLRSCLTPTLLFPVATMALGAPLLFGGDSKWVLLFAIGGFAFAAIMLVLALGEPFGRRRSATGEAEAEKWARFRNYLINLKEYGDLGAAQEILERYFAYAVALGVENVLLAQAEALGATVPHWIALPTHLPTDTTVAHGPASGERPQGALEPRPLASPPATAPATAAAVTAAAGKPAQRPRPSLSGMSLNMGTSLSNASRTMGTTLSAAAGAAATTVVLKSRLRDRTIEWGAGSNPARMLDEIMRVSMRDVENIRSRPPQRGPSAPGWGGSGLGGGSSRSTWGGGSGSSRSSSGFERSSSSSSSRSSSSSSSSRSSSSSSSSRSSSSSSRSSSSSGGGRSGFGKK